MAPLIVDARSEADTVEAGRRLGEQLRGGDVVLLVGDLGAGKTAFVRGMAAGLDADPSEVISPTFTLVQEYRGRLTLQHADLYRLAPEEVPDLALEDLIDGDAVLAVEWADRWTSPPPAAIRVQLEHAGDGARRIAVRRP